MSSCLHQDVIPVLPVFVDQQEPWRTEIDGACRGCGEVGFLMWEAYGYREAFQDISHPTLDDVLADVEEWWREFRRNG